jgi:hypothetical protein
MHLNSRWRSNSASTIRPGDNSESLERLIGGSQQRLGTGHTLVDCTCTLGAGDRPFGVRRGVVCVAR